MTNVIKILFIVVLLQIFLMAEIFYVDSFFGKDDLPGTESAPFQTIQKAADVMNEGDVCIIKKGIYRETIVLNKNNLTFKNYESDYVLITGLDVIQNWNLYQGEVFQAASNKRITQVFVNGKRMNWARYPNENGNMFDLSELDGVNIETQQPTGEVMFERMQPMPTNFWMGAYFIGLPGNRNWWTAHKGRITSSQDKRIRCTDLSGLWENPVFSFTGEGLGYIIGSLNALDTAGEWHWQNNSLYLYPPEVTDINDVIIEGRTRIHGFDFGGSNNITLEGLHLKAADIHLVNSNNCTINKCTVRYPGAFSTYYLDFGLQRDAWGDFENGASGIYIGGDNNVIKDSYIGKTWSHGITLWGNNNTVQNSIIEHTNWMGERMSPVFAAGNDNKIIHNTLRYSGRDGIDLGNRAFRLKYALRALVQYNHIHDVGLMNPDAGFLYTNHQGSQRELANTEISYNIMHDFLTNHGGVYLDNSSSGYKVHHNVMWNSPTGVNINDIGGNPVANHIYNNTFIDISDPIRHNRPGTNSEVIARNNLSNVDGFDGTTTSNNRQVSLDIFINHQQRDYGLKPNTVPIDDGVHIEGITVNTIGPPDIGAYEFGVPKWTAGSDITVPIFIDETGQLSNLINNTGIAIKTIKTPNNLKQLIAEIEKGHTVKIRNIKGRVLFNSAQGMNYDIDISEHSNGMLIIEIFSNKGIRKRYLNHIDFFKSL